MPADAAPHAPLPFGDATNRPPPPADLSFLMSQKSGPVGGGGTAASGCLAASFSANSGGISPAAIAACSAANCSGVSVF